jgi:methylase of polypeptide subunit release factors
MAEEIRLKKFPPLFLVKFAGFFKLLFHNLSKKMFPAQVLLMEYSANFLLNRALGVAVELNIADLLKERPQTISELAFKTNVNEEALYRLMRALASEGFFKDIGNRTFANTKFSNSMAEGKNSLKYFVKHHLGSKNWMLASEMEHCVRNGENAIKKLHGVEPFEYLEKFPEANEVFNRSMTDTSTISAEAFISGYDFSKYKQISDIGGGHGYLLSCILYKNKNTEGFVFDQNHVAEGAEKNFSKFGVTDRAKVISGDFFSEISVKADLYILKNVLHDWDDEKCGIILGNIKSAMPENSKILVIDAVIKDDNKPAFGKFIDLEMLIGTTGGKERTKAEFEKLFSNSGLKLNKIIENATPFSFIEVVKA